MDDDVLRSLGADLERDDPRLAALLSGEGRPRLRPRHLRIWLLLALLLTGGLFLLPLTTAVGVIVVLLAVAGPVVGCLAQGGPEGPIAPPAG